MEYTFTVANFEEEVLNSPLPVLVDFYADWCNPCKMMAPTVAKLAEAYEGKVKVGKINVDENMTIAQKYRVASIPNFVIFRDGQPVETLKNPINDQTFENLPRANSIMAHGLYGKAKLGGMRYNIGMTKYPYKQSYAEMLQTRWGTCDDMAAFLALSLRAIGIPASIDYVPAWANRSSSHCWNVVKDATGDFIEVGYGPEGKNEGYVLVKDIEQKRGNVRAVALYNPSDTICSFTVPMNILELGGKVKVRDLVKQQDLPEIKGGVLNRELPPHSVLILRMESEKRLEATVYEAEWAYLPCFNDLGKTPKSIVYAPLHEASGGMKVSYLGGRKENFAEWKEVYSEQGGEYEMTIRYVPKADRKLEVCVNNEKRILLDSLSADETQKIASITVPVHLKAGNNKIRMGSSFCWAPDIDCFTLKKVSE